MSCLLTVERWNVRKDIASSTLLRQRKVKNKSKKHTPHKASTCASQPTCGPTPWYRQLTTLSSRLISSFWLKSSSCCAAWSANIVIIAGIEICNKNSTGCSSECTKHIQQAKSCELCVQKQFQTADQPLNKTPVDSPDNSHCRVFNL